MKNPDGSSSTRHNWEKLNTAKIGRLSARANKTLSSKIIIPEEYSLNIQTLAFVKKIRELNSLFDVFDLIKALALDLLRAHKLINKPHVIKVISEYNLQTASLVPSFMPPLVEWDLLGLCYQALLTEGMRNQQGIYYTPRDIAKDLTSEVLLSEGIFLDPCCGSGSIMLAVETNNPSLLVGFDHDPIAVFIAKCNLLLRFKHKVFIPRVFCLNFLSLNDEELHHLIPEEIQAISTNPPWGAVSAKEIVDDKVFANESFALFFVKSLKLVTTGGQLNFLFPKALLNVAAHTNLREFILSRSNLRKLKTYGKLFSGVTTTYVALSCQKKSIDSTDSTKFVYITDDSSVQIKSSNFSLLPNYSFLPLNDQDANIVQKMQDIGKLSLNNSIFALGIVTGDNQHRLFKEPQDDLEPILSGKEVNAFWLSPPVYYISYDRKKLQQVAADEIYRAKEKLIYKFISSKLVFAYDNQQRLVLNSANIVIPLVDSLSTLTVLALLNSHALQYYYLKTCNELKILKSNLCRLPLPPMSKSDDHKISDLVINVMGGHIDQLVLLNRCIFEIYNLSEQEQKYILNTLQS